MKKRWFLLFLFVLIAGILLSGCTQQTKSGLNVVVTTTIIGDVVHQVGGDRINLVVLLPVGADPHTYEPRPQDVAAIHDADVVFLNGLELEHSLEPIITANATGKVVVVSDGIEVLPFSATSGDETHAAGDPHVWMDPNNVKNWVTNIEKVLTELDPTGAETYKANAAAYLEQLSTLDKWIRDEISTIPAVNRKLVTDHQSLGYFAKQYGLDLAGLILPSLSTNASTSAADMAQVEKEIKDYGIKTIFVEMSSNEAVAAQIASDTGIKYAKIYTGSLGTADSGAGTYLEFMRFNVNTIVNGVK
jgi:ABC-type Zn uptake system ZnuABC Zn-binding protein ZnuA